MIFSRPELLPLLCLPVLLGCWQWWRRGRPVVLPFDFGSLRRGTWIGLFVRSADLLPAAILAVAIFLWAGPLIEGPPVYPSQVANIQIALDTSGSMNDPLGDKIKKDGTPYTKYDAAMEAITEFTTFRKGDAFGFTIFTSGVMHWVPLTTDLSAIRLATPFVGPGTFPLKWWDGTKVGNALRECARVLEERHEGDRMIIVLTDGESPDLMNGQAAVIARELSAKNIVVYIVSIRNAVPPEELRTVAQVTGGEIFESGDMPALRSVFKRIDGLQRAKLVAAQTTWLDYFAPFAFVGIGLLVCQQLAAFGLRFTPW
ncbi:von Willebrand factor type A domain protein [Anatilimnocola aggregata]|uniref:von Willebrand factor type A domain protein n=1 Tax=Anatilimnocola aggregata TaxID=2528021 RepID=A0A517YHN6_9BACT|nr:VWA domain-containing protein [Anatilimnocola aggregata]QDU29731.1 von Willebrand factor type A domain protein [Anatilimnocola aggregata]